MLLVIGGHVNSRPFKGRAGVGMEEAVGKAFFERLNKPSFAVTKWRRLENPIPTLTLPLKGREREQYFPRQ